MSVRCAATSLPGHGSRRASIRKPADDSAAVYELSSVREMQCDPAAGSFSPVRQTTLLEVGPVEDVAAVAVVPLEVPGALDGMAHRHA